MQRSVPHPHLIANLSLLQARFPGVAAAREELADAHAALEGLLPEMRREVRQPRLQYTSVINQGDHMIELPVDFRGVPKVRSQVHSISLPDGCDMHVLDVCMVSWHWPSMPSVSETSCARTITRQGGFGVR